MVRILGSSGIQGNEVQCMTDLTEKVVGGNDRVHLVSHLFFRAQEFDLRGALSDSGDRRLEESNSPKSTPSEFWRSEFVPILPIALPPNISQPLFAQYSAHLLCHLSDPRRNQVLIEKSGLSDY